MRHDRGPVYLPETLTFVELYSAGVLLEDEQAQGIEVSLARLGSRDGEQLCSQAQTTETLE